MITPLEEQLNEDTEFNLGVDEQINRFNNFLSEMNGNIESEMLRQIQDGVKKNDTSFETLENFNRQIKRIQKMWRSRHHDHLHLYKAYENYSERQMSAIGTALERKTSINMVLPRTAEYIAEAMEKQKHHEASNHIFELLIGTSKNKEKASLHKLLRLLKHFGLQEDDPRLKSISQYIKSNQDSIVDEDSHRVLVDREQFAEIIAPCLGLVGDTIRNQSVIPNWTDFVEVLRGIFEECKSECEGVVAHYIPQLSRQDPNLWGMAVCSVDGQRVHFGDSKKRFCLQSVSKAFNYAIVSNDIGPDELHKFVGYEPSGRLFNEICLDSAGKPHNPMINAGAIVVTSLIREGNSMADRFDYILQQYSKLAAGEYVGFDNATFLSERETADRNYALSYYMKEMKCFPKMRRVETEKQLRAEKIKNGEKLDPEEQKEIKEETWKLREELDLYFQLCSIDATCESVSVMAATLANGGVNPLTRERIIDSVTCRNVLSLMYSCGMYDFSGKFAFSVGLPAKSGVSGGMVVVIPNVAGFCLFSPPLDNMGNSTRGVKFCQKMISFYNFHNYDSVLNIDEKKKDPRRNGSVTQTVEPISLYLFAAKNGDLDYIKRHHSHGHNMNAKNCDDRTALHVAASEGRLEVVKYLVEEAKLSIRVKDRWGNDAITNAMISRQSVVQEYLMGKYTEDKDRYDAEEREEKEMIAKIMAKKNGEIHAPEDEILPETPIPHESEPDSPDSLRDLNPIPEIPESEALSKDTRPDIGNIRQAADSFIKLKVADELTNGHRHPRS